MATAASTEMTRRKIHAWLEELDPDDLKLIERMVASLRQCERETSRRTYPTVVVPAGHLAGWVNLLSEGYEGDAVADTEAIYDEVDCP